MAAWVGYGKGNLTLMKDEVNSRWIVETEGLFSVTTSGDLTERFYTDGRIEIENTLLVSFNNDIVAIEEFYHNYIFGERCLFCHPTGPISVVFLFYRIGNVTETSTRMYFIIPRGGNVTQSHNVKVKLEASWVAP